MTQKRGPKPRSYSRDDVMRRAKQNLRYYDGVGDWEKWAAAALSNARQRARKANVQCTLTKADLLEMLKECDYRCPVTLVPMVHHRGRGAAQPDSVSLDRLDPDGDYSRDNTWLVSFAVNFAKGHMSLHQLVRLGAYAQRALAGDAEQLVRMFDATVRGEIRNRPHTVRRGDADQSVAGTGDTTH